jgi:hypothetical protein
MVLLEVLQGDVFQRQTGDVDGKSERALVQGQILAELLLIASLLNTANLLMLPLMHMVVKLVVGHSNALVVQILYLVTVLVHALARAKTQSLGFVPLCADLDVFAMTDSYSTLTAIVFLRRNAQLLVM